jgi:hypothetical protein
MTFGQLSDGTMIEAYTLRNYNGVHAHCGASNRPSSGREMEVWTSEPGVQIYSAIHLDGSVVGKGRVAYKKVRRALPRDAALSLLAQSCKLPVDDTPARFPSSVGDNLPVFCDAKMVFVPNVLNTVKAKKRKAKHMKEKRFKRS